MSDSTSIQSEDSFGKIVETCLWDTLHDTHLCRIEVGPESCSALLEFEIPYLIKFHRLVENTKFQLVFHSVESTTVEDLPSWQNLEFRLKGGSDFVWIYEATLLTGPGEKVALKLFGNLDQSSYPSITICAKTLSIRTSDGVELTLDQFLKYGQEYWEAFAARSQSRKATSISTG